MLTAIYIIVINERKFSLLKFVKTANRSKMGNERLDFLMAMKSERDILDNLKMTSLIAE